MGGPHPRERGLSAELLSLAEDIAREAGAQLRDAAAGGGLRTQAKSSPTDLVSEADVAAERLIRERLQAARPDDGMLGEEGSDTAGTSGLRWICTVAICGSSSARTWSCRWPTRVWIATSQMLRALARSVL